MFNYLFYMMDKNKNQYVLRKKTGGSNNLLHYFNNLIETYKNLGVEIYGILPVKTEKEATKICQTLNNQYYLENRLIDFSKILEN